MYAVVRERTLKPVALVLVVSSLCLATALIAGSIHEVPPSIFYRDPVAVLEGAFAIGWFSHFGAVVWITAGTVLLFAASLVDGHERRSLGLLGALTVLLGADDLFLLHDGLFAMLGVPSLLVSLLYGGLMATWLGLSRRSVRDSRWPLLAAGTGLLAASVFVDLLHDAAPASTEAVYLLEDVAKLAGILFWSLYGLDLARTRVLRGLRRAGGPAGVAPPRARPSAAPASTAAQQSAAVAAR